MRKGKKHRKRINCRGVTSKEDGESKTVVEVMHKAGLTWDVWKSNMANFHHYEFYSILPIKDLPKLDLKIEFKNTRTQ